MSKKTDIRTQIARLQFGSTIIYAALAGIAFWLMNTTSYQLTIGHLAKNELASIKSAVLVPGSHAFMDIQMRTLVVAILLLSIVIPVLSMNLLQKYYAASLKKRVSLLRWIDMAIVAALMVTGIAMISGVQNLLTIKLMGAFIAFSCLLGWFCERAANEGKTLVKPLFITSLVSGSMPWITIAVYALATPFYAAVRAPWYAYALYFSTLGTFSLLALNQWRQHQKYKQWKDYLLVERNYLLINIISRVAFAAILIVGLQK